MQIVAITALDKSGLTYQWFTKQGKQKHTGSLRWGEILKADVFKRDMVIYDLICMQLTPGEGDSIEVDEDDVYWEELVRELPKYLIGFKKWAEWFIDVAFPAFKTNLHNVYTKK